MPDSVATVNGVQFYSTPSTTVGTANVTAASVQGSASGSTQITFPAWASFRDIYSNTQSLEYSGGWRFDEHCHQWDHQRLLWKYSPEWDADHSVYE